MRRVPGYILQQRIESPTRLLLIKENQISQFKEFSAFLCMRKCNSLSLLKLFLLYAPELSGTSFLCFHILSFLRVHQFTVTIHVDCNCWWLWHPLFTDKAGNIPFLTWMYLFCSSLNLIPSHCIFRKKKKKTELILPSLSYITRFYFPLNLSISMETYYFFCVEKLKQSPYDPPVFPFYLLLHFSNLLHRITTEKIPFMCCF